VTQPAPTKSIVNTETGAIIVIELTPEEIAEREEMAATAATEAEAQAVAHQERAGALDDLRGQYTAAMTRLNDIVTNGPTYTSAQARDGLVDVARITLRLLRFIRAEYGDG
jgi:hypothetical protein